MTINETIKQIEQALCNCRVYLTLKPRMFRAIFDGHVYNLGPSKREAEKNLQLLVSGRPLPEYLSTDIDDE